MQGGGGTPDTPCFPVTGQPAVVYSLYMEHVAEHLGPCRYQGREGWAPASYLTKVDMQAQKQSAGGAANASTSDLEGASRQNQLNNGAKDPQKEPKLSPFSDGSKLSECVGGGVLWTSRYGHQEWFHS